MHTYKLKILHFLKNNPNTDGIDVALGASLPIEQAYGGVDELVNEGLISRTQTGMITMLMITPQGLEKIADAV